MFEKKFPGDDFLYTHTAGWDAVYLIAKAIETAGSTDGAKIKSALETTADYPASVGPSGYTITCTPKKHLCVTTEALVYHGFVDGKPSVVTP